MEQSKGTAECQYRLRGRSSKKLQEEHPLVDNGVKIVPSITRVFRKDQNLIVYFEVYEPAKSDESKTPSLSADLALFRGRAKIFESAPVRLQKLNSKRPDTAAFQFQVPLKDMQPGQYTCQINVIDEHGPQVRFLASAHRNLAVRTELLCVIKYFN